MEALKITFDPSDGASMHAALQAMADQISALNSNVRTLSMIVGLGISLADNPGFRTKSTSEAFVMAIEAMRSADLGCLAADMLGAALRVGSMPSDPGGGLRPNVVRLSERMAKAA
jgi:hypothetical protein